jgi:hypothetical protein
VVADNQHGKVRGMVLRALERPMHRNKENAMSVSDRIQESTKRVEARTRDALAYIEKALDDAERQNLRTLELRASCPRILAVLARLGGGQIPIEHGEVAIAQAAVLDVANGVSDDLGFGRQAGAEQVATQTITLAASGNLSELQNLTKAVIRHAVAFQA